MSTLSNRADHAKAALEVFLGRGQNALEALEKRDFHSADLALLDRDKAFQNYRALDYLASEGGIDLARDPEALHLVHQIVVQQRTLIKSLNFALEAIALDMQQESARKRILDRYHSGAKPKGYGLARAT